MEEKAAQHLHATVEWASTALSSALAGQRAARVGDPPEAPPGLRAILDRFALSPDERRLLELLLAVETDDGAAGLARRLSSAPALTVAALRATLGEEAPPLLAGRASLRAHGLISVTGVPGGAPSSCDLVTLAPGVAAHAAGTAFDPRDLGTGVDVVEPAVEKPTLPDPIVQLVRDNMIDVKARWVAMGGARRNDDRFTAMALAQRLRRPVLLVDGTTVGRLEGSRALALLAWVRRESDLRDLPIVVGAAASLGGLWRPLAIPPCPTAAVATPIVLLDAGEIPETRPHPSFRVHEVTFSVPPEEAPRGEAAATPTEPLNEGFESARRQAMIDAARALGKPIKIERESLPSKAVVPRAFERDEQRVAPTVVKPVEARPVEAAPAPTVAPKPVEAAPQPPAAPPAGEKPVEAPPAPAEEPRPAEAQAAAETPPATEAPPPPAAPAAPDPSESLPYLEVPEEATIADLVKLAYQTPNPLQRIELVKRLSQEKREVLVAGMLRAFVKAEHAGVRAAAEEGMSALFGPNWNRTKAIPKPVQPPRSDDVDRGPPGGF